MKYELKISPEGSSALNSLAQQGFSIPTGTDIDMPKLPEDITELHAEALMELFTQLTGFLDFVSYQVVLAEIDERTAERTLDLVTAKVTAELPKSSVAIAKATAQSHRDVVDANHQYSVAHNYRKLIQVMAENLHRASSLVSRELTRRTSDGVVMKRSMRFTP